MAANEELADASLVEPVYSMADQLLRDAITAYSEHDSVLGAGLHDRDKEVDKIYKKVTATYGLRIEQSDGRSQDYLHLILVARSLERVGDLSVNIGEDAVFLESAKDLRHSSDRGL
jgi:phosphate transport system protein